MRSTCPPPMSLMAILVKLLSLFVLIGGSWAAQAACNPCSPTSVGLSANPANQAYRQQTIILTAVVTGANSSLATGFVDFIDNGQVVARAALNAGQASTTVKYQAIGSHALTARYTGDASNAPSATAAATSLTVVDKIATSIYVVPSPSSANAGQDVTLTSTIANGVNPTGTVTFKDGGVAIGSPVPVAGGKATLTTSFVSAGTHMLSASYSGDVAHQSTNGSAIPITIVASPQASLWFNTSGEVLFANSLDPNASLQLGNPNNDPRIVNIPEATGVRNADGGLGYGKVADPLNEGDGPWLQHRVISTDGNSHGSPDKPVMRSEESMAKTLALGDEVWVVFEWFTPPTLGLGQLKARSNSDLDSVTIFQLHDPGTPGYQGALPYVALTVSSSPAFPDGYRTVDIAKHEWKSDTLKFSGAHQANWLPGGKPGKYFGSSTIGYSDPKWPAGSVGVKEAWAFHIKLHHQTGQFYTRAWMATRGGPVVQIVNDTTTPNVPDISKSGGSAAAVAYIKDGIYAFNHPAAPTWFDWRTMKRHFQVLRNQNGILTSTGLSEDAVAAQLIRQAQSK
jgi:hypothetical protein